MSTVYICEDTEHDMDPFIAVDRDGIFLGLEDLCGGSKEATHENMFGVVSVYWIDNLNNQLTVRCVPQTEIYGDKKALDQLKVA